ncbi:shikimate kinase [Venenivibrio stagnispumantis]|uniref:Shikimate kinase n=1 Tax=Venenivibrio stagnispumantis TaxID=407998 RepID=A0AA45WP73_9AQUI|nr:shikimate kinase [Venenivibrio stagnispumantis]MCW4573372.1 shikimate kinase [Venenivibrio stagnispumantis]SMP20879.1 shikimate kinase [Venenivibrio stagnispumantis]
MKNIFLIGFMGSGKSTIGRLLAEKLNMKFIDIDKEIEKKEGKSIKDIFKEKGESYFRELERKEIELFSEKSGYVVSTGGGLGANKDNMEKMKKNGIVIWLDVSLEEVLKRCGNDKNRPLLQLPFEELKKLYEERKKIYSLADIHINVNSKTPQEILKEIYENL